jgi:hypothetical protein
MYFIGPKKILATVAVWRRRKHADQWARGGCRRCERVFENSSSRHNFLRWMSAVHASNFACELFQKTQNSIESLRFHTSNATMRAHDVYAIMHAQFNEVGALVAQRGALAKNPSQVHVFIATKHGSPEAHAENSRSLE